MDPPELTLTNDEKFLHCHAVTLKNMLEDYRASKARHEKAWRDQFEELLVYLCLYEYSYKLSQVCFRGNQ
jgi:hypothetical protein